MNNDNGKNLAPLAADIAELRQQLEQIGQQLDMIYGAVTRLAGSKPQPVASTPPTPALDPGMMMTPASMFESLHQHAVQAGLNISSDVVERLQSQLSAGEASNE